jgi:hypothetical protein
MTLPDRLSFLYLRSSYPNAFIKKKGPLTMPLSKRLLQIAGLLSLAVALFQIVLGFSPALSTYFGASPDLLANPVTLLAASLFVALIFAIWGLYGLSGAGLLRRLPLLRLGLLAIGAIYTLRGLLLIPLLLASLGLLASPEPILPQALLASFVSLLVGCFYLAGTIAAWRDLKPAIPAR